MVLYVIGLGLGDEKDITVRGLEAVRGSVKVVLEHYTSILGVDKAKLVSGVWSLCPPSFLVALQHCRSERLQSYIKRQLCS